MNTPPPLLCTYDGEAFVPKSPRFADRYYAVGAEYPMVVHEHRSSATHNHEFAWLHDAWANLPEGIAELYPSAEHLRKRALVEAGFYDEQIVDAGSNAAAIRVASAFRSREEFSVIIVRGPLVVIRAAKSQSRRAMNKAEFQASKTAIMEIISNMIGVTPEQLKTEAGRAA